MLCSVTEPTFSPPMNNSKESISYILQRDLFPGTSANNIPWITVKDQFNLAEAIFKIKVYTVPT